MGLFDLIEKDLNATVPNVEETGLNKPTGLIPEEDKRFQEQNETFKEETSDPNREIDFDSLEMSEEQKLQERNQAVGQETQGDLFSQGDLESGSFVSAQMIDAGINEQFGNSLSRGVGTVLGGFGDLFQAVPGLVGSAFGSEKGWQENTISDFFHKIGNTLQVDNQNYVPEEFQEIKLNSLASLQGWKYLITNQLAETLPYMAEFVLTGMGAGSLAKKGATKLAQKKLAEMALKAGRRGTKSGMKKLVKSGAIKEVLRDGAERSLVKGGSLGERIQRSLLTENGLSKTGQGLASTIGAGAANNQLIALTQAAEAVNMAKAYKDDEGNRLFNDDELAQIGVDTWQTEFAYMAADIASWGFTFGKVPKGMLKGFGVKSGKSLTKTTGERVAKVLAKAGIEGTEETVQETWEEWAKQSSIQKARMEKGEISEEEYDNESFFDFYMRKENEGLKVVSFIAGGLMAGAKASIDLMGEKAALLRDKEELVKAQIDRNSDPELYEAQKIARQYEIAEQVKRGYHDTLNDTYKEWVESGSATEEEYNEFAENTNEYVKLFNQSQNLNIDGAERLYSLMVDRKADEIVLEKRKKELKEKIKEIKALNLGPEVEKQFAKEQQEELNKLQEEFNKRAEEVGGKIKNIVLKKPINVDPEKKKKAIKNKQESLIKESAENQEVDKTLAAVDNKNKQIENLQTGKKFEAYKNSETGEVETNEKGELLGKGLSDEAYNKYTDSAEKERELKNKESLKNKGGNVFSKGIEVFKNIFSKSKKKNNVEDKNQESETVEDVEEVKNTEEVTKKEVGNQNPEKDTSVEVMPNFTKKSEDEYFDSLETEEDKFDSIIDRVLHDSKNDEKNATPLLIKKLKEKFGNDPEVGKRFFEHMQKNKSDNFDSARKRQNELRNKFISSGKAKTKNITWNPKSKKAEKPKGGRFRKNEFSPEEKPKSEGRKKLEEAAAKEKTSVRDYLARQVKNIREKIKDVKNSKEAQKLIDEIQSLEEYDEIKNSKFFKGLQNIKNDQTLNKLIFGLEEKLKETVDFNKRLSIQKQIKRIKDQKKAAKFNKTPRIVTKKITEEVRQGMISYEEAQSMHGLSAVPGTNARLSIIKENLKKSHPEINIVMVDDLSNVIGIDSMAYVIGSTVFINPQSVYQPDVIAHEFSHVYYNLTKEDESTKRLVNILSKNTDRVNKIKNQYWPQLAYKISNREDEEIVYPEDYDIKSKESFISSYEAAGYTVTELPIEEQEVIKDELFAYHMESKITESYDAYFNPKERKRRLNFYEKGFWKNVKSKLSLGFLPSVEKEKTLEYLRDLDIDGIPSTVDNLETYITKEFKKGFSGKELHQKVRQGRRRIDEYDTKLNDSIEKSMKNAKDVFNDNKTSKEYEKELEKEFQLLFGSYFKNLAKDDKQNFYENALEDELEKISEMAESEVTTGSLEDKADVLVQSVTNQLNDFVKEYNEDAIANKDKVIDRNAITGPLRHLAFKHFDNNTNFIKALEEQAENSFVLEKFLEFTSNKYGQDYKSRLVSTHTVYANNAAVNSFIIEMDDKGVNVSPGLSNQDNYKVDSLIQNFRFSQSLLIAKNKGKKNLKKKDLRRAEMFSNFEKSVRKAIDDKPLSNEDWNLINSVLFSSLGINPDLKEIFIDGKTMPYKKAVKEQLKRKVKKYKKNGVNINPYDLRPLFTSVVAGNRIFGNSLMAQNAEGNNVSMEQKSNFIINENRRIFRDAINPEMTEKAFMTKYSKNPLAALVYRSKRAMAIYQNLGMKKNSKSSVYKNSGSDPVFLQDLVLFMKNDGKKYYQSLPINGESARRYYTSVPMIKVTKSDNQTQEQFDKQYKAITSQAEYLAWKNGDTKRFNKVGGNKLRIEIIEEQKRLISHFENNPEQIEELQKGFDYKILENGKITPAGRVVLKSYAANSMINQIYARDLFYSGITEEEMGKRSKSAGAPITPINASGNLRFGLINVSDLKFDSSLLGDIDGMNINSTDSMNFMLPEDTERVQAIYGSGMKVGKNIKLFGFSKERENPNAMNKNVTIKGLTFTLTDEFVKKNPGYKPLRDALRAQRNYIEQKYGKLHYNLNNGQPNFIPLAVGKSALKTGGDKLIKENTISLNDLKDTEKALEKINQLNEYEGGYGFDGSDVGVQNLMDKEYEKSVLASQFITNFFNNASNLGNMKQVEGIQRRIKEIAEENLRRDIIRFLPKDVNNITNKDLENLRKFLDKKMNKDAIDVLTKSLIDDHTVTLPYVQSRVSQIMKNAIVKSGMRMYTDGTVGLQMSDYGFYEAELDNSNKVKSIQSKLKSYGRGDESTFWRDSKGNDHRATTPAEAIIPHHYFLKADTRLREYYDTESAARIKAREIASNDAREQDLRNDDYKNYVNKHTELLIGEDDKKGFFVRGEIFTATRIPSHGLQTSLVLEAKETAGEGMGSAVIVPSELSAIMGSDFDGDALYMNLNNNNKFSPNSNNERNNLKRKERALKSSMIDYMTKENIQGDLMIPLDIAKVGKEVNQEILNVTGVNLGLDSGNLPKNNLKDKPYVLSPTGQKEAYKDNVETRQLVGISASLHRFLNVLSAYEVPFDMNININGVTKNKFKDEGDNNQRSTKTALLLNVILDNAKNKIAEKMGINPATAPQYILLAGMGYDIPTISTIMLSDGAKAWEKASRNRNNIFVKEKNKHETLKKAKEIAGVDGRLNKDIISIDTKNIQSLNSVEGKKAVLQLLSQLDDMQSEAFKVNGVLSTHKKLDSNPYILENQLNEFNEMFKNDGLIKYPKSFKESYLVRKYERGLKLAIDVNKKTNTVYSATGRNLMKSINERFEKEFTPKDFNLIMSKIMKALYLDPFKENFNFDTNTIKETLYGKDNVFDKLITHFIETGSQGGKSLLQQNLNITYQNNQKRITLNKNLEKYGNKEMLQQIRKDFSELPQDIQDGLVIYDFVENALQGSNSIFPIFDNDTINILGESFNKLLSKNARSKNESTLANQKNEMYRSLHELAEEISEAHISRKGDIQKEDPQLFESIVKNKPFIRKVNHSKGWMFVVEFQPLTDDEITEIKVKTRDLSDNGNPNDYSLETKKEMVKQLSFKKVGRGIPNKDLGTFNSPLYSDINILNANMNDNDNDNENDGPGGGVEIVDIEAAKKKSSVSRGRMRYDGADDITHEMNRDEWNNRNNIYGNSTESNKAFKEYKKQYYKAKQFFKKKLANDEVEGMTDKELYDNIELFSSFQAEAASIALNPLQIELGRRLSIKGTEVTGKTEGKDLSIGEKWFVSSNIPSRLPAMQSLAKKVSERFKKFLRSRNKDYEKIDKVTKALYKSKFSSKIVRYNPFKTKNQYEHLYGNLVVKETVGEDTNNFRLKDKSVIEALYKNGKISKQEKDFYDVFTEITTKYKGLLDGKDTRRGYIPHTKQSLIESYSNRGLLGAFMNSQTTEEKTKDVVLTGYDPIKNEIVTQSFKKFEDSYNAASQNQEFGNKNKWKFKDLALLKFKASRLLKKGINEDGTEIKPSTFSIETLANSGTRNRFTNQRSDKATLYPSMDLNKAIMDYTHSSAFASQFRDMLPEVQGLISYYKQRGNKNAVDLLETYYRDKIIRGKNPTTVLGKTGDKFLKLGNAIVVFKLLGFQTAFVAGNIIAGKYHNLKNGKNKEWANGEKRFWGFDGKEKGIKGWAKNFKSSIDFLRKIGFMEQNIYEDINLEKEWNPINKLETLALMPMTLSEKWIQGVQFLGMLTDEEWKAWKEDGKMISIERQSQLEDDVKKSQGRGYNFTDQRMISLYSLGQSLMMFNKFIPTMMNDRFGQEEIDAYNRKNIGSLRQFKDTAKDVISGRMSYGEFKEYRNNLPEHKKVALDKAVKGMALVTLAAIVGSAAGGVGDDDTKYLMHGLVLDANYSINLPKLARKASNIPTVTITKDLIN